MGEIKSNTTLEEIVKQIERAERIVLTTHVKPDGDAFGGTLALARMIARLGKQVEIWHVPPANTIFQSLLGNDEVHLVEDGKFPSEDVDLILVVDTCAWSQLENFKSFLENKRERICVIDHHIQGDDIARWCYTDPTAGSVCEILTGLVGKLGLVLDEELATPLYLGIATDTGWFRFSNTTARTMRLAAELLEADVKHNSLMQLSEQQDRPNRLRLMARALHSLELLNADRVAVISLRHEDYVACDASSEDNHGFADLPLSVKSIEMVCVITESKSGIVKLSLRSKAGPDAINVSDFAARFGGGGHARASGAKITDMSFDEVHDRILAGLKELS